MSFYKAVFKPNPSLVAALDTFLLEKLKEPCRHRIGHAARIIIECPDRDSVFRVAEWLRNARGKNLLYSVIGYTDDGKIEYLSACPKCRNKEGPHYTHGG